MRDSRDASSSWVEGQADPPFQNRLKAKAVQTPDASSVSHAGRNLWSRLLQRKDWLGGTRSAARRDEFPRRSVSLKESSENEELLKPTFSAEEEMKASSSVPTLREGAGSHLSDSLPLAISLFAGSDTTASTPRYRTSSRGSLSTGLFGDLVKKSKATGAAELASQRASSASRGVLAAPQAPLRRHRATLRSEASFEDFPESSQSRRLSQGHQEALCVSSRRLAADKRLWHLSSRVSNRLCSPRRNSACEVPCSRQQGVFQKTNEAMLRGRLQRLCLTKKQLGSRLAKASVLHRRRAMTEGYRLSDSPKLRSDASSLPSNFEIAQTPSTAAATPQTGFLSSPALKDEECFQNSQTPHVGSRSPPRKRLHTSPVWRKRRSASSSSSEVDEFALPPAASELLSRRSACLNAFSNSRFRNPSEDKSSLDEGTEESASSASSFSSSLPSWRRCAASASSSVLGASLLRKGKVVFSRGDAATSSGPRSKASCLRRAALSRFCASELKKLEKLRKQRPHHGTSHLKGTSAVKEECEQEETQERILLKETEGISAKEEAALPEFRVEAPWRPSVDLVGEESDEEKVDPSDGFLSARPLSPWQHSFDQELDRLVEMPNWVSLSLSLPRNRNALPARGVCADTAWLRGRRKCGEFVSAVDWLSPLCRENSVSWSDLPLGLRLCVCWFLNESDLQSLALAGSSGREATSHPHCWMLRCTRRWAPCLAHTDRQTQTLPFGRNAEFRLDLRRRLRSLLTGPSVCEALPSEDSPPSSLSDSRQRERTSKEATDGAVRADSTFNPASLWSGGGAFSFWKKSSDGHLHMQHLCRGEEADGASSICSPSQETSAIELANLRKKEKRHNAVSRHSSAAGVSPWERWAAVHLNDAALNFDYRMLLLTNNGWKAAVSESGFNGTRLFWERRKVEANPPFVNTMDGRCQHGVLYLASEACSRIGGPPGAELRSVSLADLRVINSMAVSAKAINCLDVSPQVLVCGDDSGLVHVVDPATLQIRTQYHARASALPGFHMGHRREVNDIRLCRAEGQALAVRTASRFPAGLELIDLETGVSTDISPQRTQGNWIHAVDLDPLPSRCPYTGCATSGEFCNFCCGGSSPLRCSSSSNVVAVGESTAARCFSLLRLDLRMSRPVVQQKLQTQKMLWPLRVSGHKAFINSVFDAEEFKGRIRQFDMRMVDPTPDEGQTPLASEDCTIPYRGGLLHLLNGSRVEDFRIFDGHPSLTGTTGNSFSVQAYVLQNDHMGLLSISRFNTLTSGGVETVSVVDTFKAEEWNEPLKLLLVYDQGWTCTYGNNITVGSMGNSPSPDIVSCPSLI